MVDFLWDRGRPRPPVARQSSARKLFVLRTRAGEGARGQSKSGYQCPNLEFQTEPTTEFMGRHRVSNGVLANNFIHERAANVLDRPDDRAANSSSVAFRRRALTHSLIVLVICRGEGSFSSSRPDASAFSALAACDRPRAARLIILIFLFVSTLMPGYSQLHIVRTTRNCASPLSIRA